MRFDLRAGLVSLPADHGQPLLHHLPDLQLGSLYDVHPHAVCEGLLLSVTAGACCGDLADLGALCRLLPGAVLGKVQRSPQMRRMHRQTVYPILSETEKTIRKNAPKPLAWGIY